MGNQKETKEKVTIEKDEIEKIAEELAKDQVNEEDKVENIELSEELLEEKETIEEEISESEEKAEEVEETQQETLEESEKSEEATQETEEEKVDKKKPWKIVGIVAGAIFAALLVVYIVGAIFFSKRFLIGTTVNGVECTGQTVEEVRVTMQKEVEQYALTIETKADSTEVIKGKEIDIKYNGIDVIEDAMEDQTPYLWFLGFFNKNAIKANIDFTYDKTKLDEKIGQLECMKAENQVAPVAAIPAYADGKYEIQEEVYGTQIDQEKFYAAIHSSVDEMEKAFNIEKKECYVPPVYTKDSKEVIAAKDALNKCLEANITYSIDGVNVTVDATKIVNWLTVDAASMAVDVDANQVREFADTLGSYYNTPNTTEQITTPTGKVATIPNARLGRVVGSAAECEQLINEIKAGTVITREPMLSQRPSSADAVAWGGTYIEVDITEQHMWYIQDGAVVFESDIVTGSPGRDTPVGYYTILEKLQNKVLRGNVMPNGKREYETPVKYWARVTWSGVGFHDATWQPVFGGQRYKQGFGSHGCINMPLNAVATFYGMIEVGCPVLIHH